MKQLNFRSTLAFAGLILGVTLSNVAMSKTFTSQSEATDVIELYTSEGCSSCPPAERWLSTLKNKPEVFRDVIPMAFHVDYWDYIGWKDRFAKPAYSLRQREHVQQRNTRQSYTPQFVTNNEEWRSWFSGDREWDKNTKTVGVLRADIASDKKTLQVEFSPQRSNWSGSVESPANYVVNVAVLGMGLQSSVTAGENVGVKLHHDFVVLNHAQQTVAASPSKWQLNMPPIPNSGQLKTAIAVWLSEPETQRTIQATGGYL